MTPAQPPGIGLVLIVVAAPQGRYDPLHEAVLIEFEHLMLNLDLKAITRPEWERLKAILAIATLEAGDVEAGRDGYHKAMSKWRKSMWYDGRP